MNQALTLREKLRALSVATSHSFPTADIDEMLAQIGKGYSGWPA
jgi:hypothetical protein